MWLKSEEEKPEDTAFSVHKREFIQFIRRESGTIDAGPLVYLSFRDRLRMPTHRTTDVSASTPTRDGLFPHLGVDGP
jgi:hypothetical protein